MSYRNAGYATGAFDTYVFEKNIFGDIVAVYDLSGTKLVSYKYDAWGNTIPTYHNGTTSTSIAARNPFKYRGYYYDSDIRLYYLQTRYYDSVTGRFINADGYVSTGQGMLGNNMFAYCNNNPVMFVDPTGEWPKWIKNIASKISSFFASPKQVNETDPSSHDDNRRPNTGEPGSTYTAPNGDSRTYGPDGTPEHDYDHNDHGRPDKHPHDENGGHNHDWENGVRGPAYCIGWKQIAGAAIITICIAGIFIVAVDDASGVGVVDDFLFGPLGAGVGGGLTLILG